MAFMKNWKQIIVSLGEPFQIEFLDRRYGGRSRTNRSGTAVPVFKINDTTGSVEVGGVALEGAPTFTYGGTAGAPTITAQLRDAAGNKLARKSRLAVWVSATAGGTPIGTDVTGLTTTFTTGVIALTKLANLDFDIITSSTGTLTAVLTDAAGLTTRFVNVQVGERVYSSKAIITPA